MGFDLERFKKAKLEARTTEVRIPELKDWFAENTEPVFTVRGLTGEQFYHVREAAAKRVDVQAIIAKLTSGDGAAIAEALDEHFGAVPGEYARRVEILIYGCVDPSMDRPTALKFYRHFPVHAHTLADAILRASGEGAVLGESKGSGGTPASAGTSTSATSGGKPSSKSARTSSRKRK
jgi:hypothetical protein